MEIPSSLIGGTVSRGDVLLSAFEGINHPKFFVVMGISQDKICGFFFINSNVNKYLFGKNELLAMQYPLRHCEYEFLRHDSFLCASDVKEMPLTDIAEGIKNANVDIIGRLKDNDIENILEMVNNSPVIRKIHKKRYFQR